MDINFCLEMAARGALPLAGAAVAAWVLRRSSAAARHAVWAAGAAGALAVPGLMLGAPAWPIPLPSRAASGVIVPAEVPWDEPAGAIFPAAAEPLALADGPAVEEAPAPPAASEPAVFRAPVKRFSWSAVALWAWLVGAMAVAVPGIVGRLRLRGLRQRSSALEGGRQAEVAEELIGRLCPGRRVVVARSAGEHSPMTWGSWRPVVLLPAGSGEWSEALFRSVVAHELAHVRRLDTLWQAVAGLACVLYWFNPLAWLAAGRLRVERELACDDLVLSLGERPSAYASHLLAIARHPRAPMPALAMARPSRLEGRLRAILDPSLDHRPLRRRSMLAIAVAGLLLTLPLAGARPARAVQEPAPAREEPAGTTVTGRVIDPEGKAVAGANVAVVGFNLTLDPARHEVLGRAETGADGSFAVEGQRIQPFRYSSLQVLAHTEGFGLGWASLDRDQESPTAEVRLPATSEVSGRVEFEWEPVAGAKVRVESIEFRREVRGNNRVYLSLTGNEEANEQLDGLWPPAVVTGSDGGFRLAGFAPDATVKLRIDAPGFAPQSFSLAPEQRQDGKTFSLRPSVEVLGRVTYADTGEPVEGARVRGNSPGPFVEQQTGPDGRFSFLSNASDMLTVGAYPPAGVPYLDLVKMVGGGVRDERHEINLAVPRGALFTGRVVERETGRPVEGARVRSESPVLSRINGAKVVIGSTLTDAEGRYSLAVPPGPGSLTVLSPHTDHVRETIYSRLLAEYWPPRSGLTRDMDRVLGGVRNYVHAFYPYDVKAGEPTHEVDLPIRRGETLTGQVVGPDGKPVEAAEILTTLSFPPGWTEWRGDAPIHVRDGRFELRGLPLGRSVRCYFLDAKNELGTTVDLSDAMAADGPVIVRLQPCGRARARIVDDKGGPLWYSFVNLRLIATPGPSRRVGMRNVTGGASEPAADEANSDVVDPLHYGKGIRPDDAGRLVLPALIPGATYRFHPPSTTRGGISDQARDFTVEPGQELDLGEFVVKHPEW